jgi:hypothetical protein
MFDKIIGLPLIHAHTFSLFCLCVWGIEIEAQADSGVLRAAGSEKQSSSHRGAAAFDNIHINYPDGIRAVVLNDKLGACASRLVGSVRVKPLVKCWSGSEAGRLNQGINVVELLLVRQEADLLKRQ